MHIETPSERPPELVAALVDVWERSVRATHDFLAEDDIAGLRPEVGPGVAGVAALAVAVAVIFLGDTIKGVFEDTGSSISNNVN